MTEEIQELDQSVQEEAAESIENIETPPEEAAAETPEPTEEPQEQEIRQKWAQIMPDLPFDDVAPHARMHLLLTRLAGLQGRDDPNAVTDGAGDVQKPQERPVVEVSPLDVDALEQQLAKALDEGDNAGAAKALRSGIEYMRGVGQLVSAALTDHGKELKSFRTDIDNEVRIPRKFREALPLVKGATEVDVAAAKSLLGTEAKTEKAALQLAVSYRQAGSTPPTSSDEARRKAAAINAATRARAGSRGSAPEIKAWETEQDLRELLRQEMGGG